MLLFKLSVMKSGGTRLMSGAADPALLSSRCDCLYLVTCEAGDPKTEVSVYFSGDLKLERSVEMEAFISGA
jgi:hypothetical protein